MQTEILEVHGMNDAACADTITRALQSIDGVSTVQVSLAANRATVQFDERLASSPQLHAALEQAGYRAQAVQPVAKKSGCCGGCGG